MSLVLHSSRRNSCLCDSRPSSALIEELGSDLAGRGRRDRTSGCRAVISVSNQAGPHPPTPEVASGLASHPQRRFGRPARRFRSWRRCRAPICPLCQTRSASRGLRPRSTSAACAVRRPADLSRPVELRITASGRRLHLRRRRADASRDDVRPRRCRALPTRPSHAPSPGVVVAPARLRHSTHPRTRSVRAQSFYHANGTIKQKSHEIEAGSGPCRPWHATSRTNCATRSNP